MAGGEGNSEGGEGRADLDCESRVIFEEDEPNLQPSLTSSVHPPGDGCQQAMEERPPLNRVSLNKRIVVLLRKVGLSHSYTKGTIHVSAIIGF